MIVKIDLDVENKFDALKTISQIAMDYGKVHDYRVFLKRLLERENSFSTGIGESIAIPHCACENINEIFIIICTLKNKVSWNSIDNKDVDFIVTLGIPTNLDNSEYLNLMSTLAKNLMNKTFLKELKSLDSEKEIIARVKSTIN